jgi:hypothetical protein
MSDAGFGLVSTDGTVQHVDPGRLGRANDSFQKDIDYALASQSHLWIAMAAHRITPALAKRIAEGSTEPVVMDLENLAVMGVSCYVCEEPLNRKLVDRRCPGDPEATKP